MSDRKRNTKEVRRRDPDASRERILAAATAEFASKGFGAARVDEIARRAGINKRMLYHYFGNKDDLFRAALEEIYDDICFSGTALDFDSMTPREGIIALVDFVGDYYLDHPESIALLNTENLHEARHLKSSKHARLMHPPFETAIDNLMKRGVDAGDFHPGIDPVDLYISIVGLIYYYLSNSATLSVAFERNLRDPGELTRWREHVRTVIGRFVFVAP
ncbi:MAG: TetR family transcriptional regulator [Alphaproteobacteria bacterium]|nr:TetR family transcriptional regulator [Alphaproteobacteria bacterium]